MNILYYNPGRCLIGRRLLTSIKSERLANNIAIHRNLDKFSDRLRQQGNDKTIPNILAPKEEDLLDIYFIKHLFCKTPFILLLPDRKKDTMAVGYRCKPRFMFYMDTNFAEITEALHVLKESTNFRQEPDEHEYHKFAA